MVLCPLGRAAASGSSCGDDAFSVRVALEETGHTRFEVTVDGHAHTLTFSPEEMPLVSMSLLMHNIAHDGGSSG